VSAFEALYGQKYHSPLLCSKEEACKCWTLSDHLCVTNDDAFVLSSSMCMTKNMQAIPTWLQSMSLADSPRKNCQRVKKRKCQVTTSKHTYLNMKLKIKVKAS
jgi:hypothetical protein